MAKDKNAQEIPEQHRWQLFDSLVLKAKEQDEGATRVLGSNPTWEAVDEQTRRQCFEIFVDQLKVQTKGKKSDDASVDSDDRRKGATKKAPAKKRGREEDEDEEPQRKGTKKKRED